MKLKGYDFKVITPYEYSNNSDDVIVAFKLSSFADSQDNELCLGSDVAKSLTKALLFFYIKKSAFKVLLIVAIMLVVTMCGAAPRWLDL